MELSLLFSEVLSMGYQPCNYWSYGEKKRTLLTDKYLGYDWLKCGAREDLFDILALISPVDLELENDSGEAPLGLDTTPTSGKSRFA